MVKVKTTDRRIFSLHPEKDDEWGFWEVGKQGGNSIVSINPVNQFGKLWFEVSFDDGDTVLVNADKIMTVTFF